MNGPLKLLPLLIIVFVLSFSVRLTEVITGVSNLSNTAFAESSKEKPPKFDEKNKSDKKNKNKDTKSHNKDSDDKHAKDDKNHNDKGDMPVVSDKNAKSPKWRDAGDADTDVSSIKFELFKDLSKRREELDQREKEINVREAILKVAEKEIDNKYKELTNIRNEIKNLLNQQTEEEDKRIKSLVKIYEGMKPKDAARIFDTLDLDVLISVISKMSERKVSPVLAAMNPERVRTVTIMLAEQKTLPTLR